MLPIVVTYGLAAGSTQIVVNQSPTVAAGATFTLATTNLDVQRRLLLTFSGDEHSNTFTVFGTNQAGFPISETIPGTNGTTATSVFDYKTVTKVVAVGATAATVSVGTNSTGSTLWNYVNWHVSPSNIEFSTILVSATANATWSIQYTYDDPNNLPANVTSPSPFNHPTIVNQTASIDGMTNDPITCWRLFVAGGTATIRATGIQAGIGGP
jgi:hypothetical protein